MHCSLQLGATLEVRLQVLSPDSSFRNQLYLGRQAGVSGNNGGPLFGGGGWVLAPSQYIKARPHPLSLCWLTCAANPKNPETL